MLDDIFKAAQAYLRTRRLVKRADDDDDVSFFTGDDKTRPQYPFEDRMNPAGERWFNFGGFPIPASAFYDPQTFGTMFQRHQDFLDRMFAAQLAQQNALFQNQLEMSRLAMAARLNAAMQAQTARQQQLQMFMMPMLAYMKYLMDKDHQPQQQQQITPRLAAEIWYGPRWFKNVDVALRGYVR